MAPLFPVGGVLRGFGYTATPVGPGTATFTVEDNEDGTGAVTVAGTDSTATNTFYAAPRNHPSATLQFSAYGTPITGNGTIAITLDSGYYWGYVHSELNDQTNISDIQGVDPCPSVFSRIFVWPQVATGETRVEWSLMTNFTDAGPYTFQLQVGRTGLNDADDWVDVGAPISDAYYALDDTQRVYGKFQWTHYRVKLTTGVNTYYSTPVAPLGNLTFGDWAKAREILRMERLRLKQAAGQEGYLLKRRLYGEPCSCVDPQTGEIRKPHHEECYGTGIVGGYFEPYPCFYVDLGNKNHRSHLDAGAGRGTIDDLPVVKGRMLAMPQVFSYDVWVDRDSDHRWMLHQIDSVAEVRGVPLVISAEMRLLPFSHPVYKIAIEGQVPT
jgi:hypothetical protein